MIRTMCLWLLSVPPLWVAFAPQTRAQLPDQPFQIDPVEYYGSRVLAGVLVLGIILIIYSLIRYRGVTGSALSWGILVSGSVVVPLLSLSFGTVLVFQKAERVEFCASCHLAMQSYVDDMKNPKSESLAALHYKNSYISSDQCYTCHTSYGIFGTMEAKLSGLNDLYRYYTRTFTVPIRMRAAYPNGDCLKCHAGSVKWPALHADVKQELFKGDLACLDCHRETHPAHTLAAARAPVQTRARLR